MSATVLCNQTPICANQPHHPISSASFNLKGCNLVCGNPWPNPALTKNFSPIGSVVSEIWPNLCWKTHFFKKSQRCQKLVENLPFLRNYMSKWAEISFGIRFWAWDATNQISAWLLEVNITVVRLICTDWRLVAQFCTMPHYITGFGHWSSIFFVVARKCIHL